MSEGVPQVDQAQIDALPQIQKAEGPAPAASEQSAAPTTPEHHKEGILAKLRHLLGNESKMTGPGTGSAEPANKNVVEGTPEHAAFTAGLDKMAADAKAQAAEPAHAGYGPDAQAARRADAQASSGFEPIAQALQTPAEAPAVATPVAEAPAMSDETKDDGAASSIDEALANIQAAVREQNATSPDAGDDTSSGLGKKVAAFTGAAVVGVGALGGAAGASETPTADATPAQEQVVDMPDQSSTVEADGQSAQVNIDADNPSNSTITVEGQQSETPAEGEQAPEAVDVAAVEGRVEQSVIGSTKSESVNMTDASGNEVDESQVEAMATGMMHDAMEIMKDHPELQDQLIVVKDAKSNVGLFTKDGRTVTQNENGEISISETLNASFDGSTLIATMNWKQTTTDTIETKSYPPEGTVGPIETEAPVKYQGGLFEVTMPDGSKVETCAVDNPSLIADSVSYTFKDAEGKALGTYGSLSEAKATDYVAGGSIEQSIVPKAGCEKLAEQTMLAAHDEGEKPGFDPNVDQPLMSSGGVAEVVTDENGVAHYVSKVTLPEKGIPAADGSAICSVNIQIDGIVGQALETVGWSGDFYSFTKAHGDVRLISAGEGTIALVCTPTEIPPKVTTDTSEHSQEMSVPFIVLFEAKSTKTPPPPETDEPELPRTGVETGDLAGLGGALTAAGAAAGEISRRMRSAGLSASEDGASAGGEGSGSGLMRPNGEQYPDSFASSKFAKGIGENDKANLEKAYFTWMRKDSEGRSYAKAQLESKLAEVKSLTDALTASDDEGDVDQQQAA